MGAAVAFFQSSFYPSVFGLQSVLIFSAPGLKIRQLLKQGLDWDWTGTGLELDWSNLANRCRLMQGRAYSDEI